MSLGTSLGSAMQGAALQGLCQAVLSHSPALHPHTTSHTSAPSLQHPNTTQHTRQPHCPSHFLPGKVHVSLQDTAPLWDPRSSATLTPCP